MYPVLFSVGTRNIYTYSVMLGVTAAAALALLWWSGRRAGDRRFDIGLATLVAGLIGARVVHVLTNWDYYSEQPGAIWSLRDGGLSFHGGLVIGLLAVAAMLLIWRGLGRPPENARTIAGALALPLAVGLLGGWLACLLAGCAYGQALPSPQRFYTPDLPDIYGVHAFRLPSQLLGIALALVLLATIKPLARRPGLFLIVLGAGLFVIAATRGDLTVTWGPLLAVQWVDLAIIGIGVLLELSARRGRAPDESSEPPTKQRITSL